MSASKILVAILAVSLCLGGEAQGQQAPRRTMRQSVNVEISVKTYPKWTFGVSLTTGGAGFVQNRSVFGSSTELQIEFGIRTSRAFGLMAIGLVDLDVDIGNEAEGEKYTGAVGGMLGFALRPTSWFQVDFVALGKGMRFSDMTQLASVVGGAVLVDFVPYTSGNHSLVLRIDAQAGKAFFPGDGEEDVYLRFGGGLGWRYK